MGGRAGGDASALQERVAALAILGVVSEGCEAPLRRMLPSAFPPASVLELFTRIEEVEEDHMRYKAPAVTHAVIGGVASHTLYKDLRW